jgi:hypothetical protein
MWEAAKVVLKGEFTTINISFKKKRAKMAGYGKSQLHVMWRSGLWFKHRIPSLSSARRFHPPMSHIHSQSSGSEQKRLIL